MSPHVLRTFFFHVEPYDFFSNNLLNSVWDRTFVCIYRLFFSFTTTAPVFISRPRTRDTLRTVGRCGR